LAPVIKTLGIAFSLLAAFGPDPTNGQALYPLM
jgi:hypothetical protein